jgi:ABC-type bacteriocin/lantibiotic exporter with double-glycine peptidase domain
MSKLTLLTIQKFKQDPNMELISRETDFLHKGFNPNIMLRDVKFYYDQRKQPNLEIDNLYIPPGRSLAVVGPSGAGKTTLVDVMLGILEPSSGFINISGQNPRIAISKWPGAIAYVPQDVLIIEGTIAENVALGYGQSSISKKHVKIALQIAQLTDFVETLPHGADTKIGERGIGLSGGQRQRLGIARAMYTQPRLLVLDEATSALDGITESEVTAAIANLQTNATRIIIAHRLSTVVSADQVIYISNGKIIASGKFEEIRSKIPDFDKQAKLMGL